MAYFYHMNEPVRGWEEPYCQDMNISQSYSNSSENPYYAQEDYEMEDQLELLTRRIEELENREAYGVYTINEDEWMPTH